MRDRTGPDHFPLLQLFPDLPSDHGVSEALYLRDPEQNGVELYRDRPEEEWPRDPDGHLAMTTGPLDLEGLLAETGQDGKSRPVPG